VRFHVFFQQSPYRPAFILQGSAFEELFLEFENFVAELGGGFEVERGGGPKHLRTQCPTPDHGRGRNAGMKSPGATAWYHTVTEVAPLGPAILAVMGFHWGGVEHSTAVQPANPLA